MTLDPTLDLYLDPKLDLDRTLDLNPNPNPKPKPNLNLNLNLDVVTAKRIQRCIQIITVHYSAVCNNTRFCSRHCHYGYHKRDNYNFCDKMKLQLDKN